MHLFASLSNNFLVGIFLIRIGLVIGLAMMFLDQKIVGMFKH